MKLWPFGDKSVALQKTTKPDGIVLVDAVDDVFRNYPERSITPTNLRAILEMADIGETYELMELLDAVATDPHVSSVLNTRKLAVAGAPVYFEPGDKSDRALELAKEAEGFVGSIPGFKQLVIDLLDAIYRGFSVVQTRWDMVDGQLRIVSYDAIESRHFKFAGNELRLLDRTREGVPLPEDDSIIVHTSRDKAGPICRGGIGRSIAKPWLYKGFNLVDCVSYLERFGTPHVVVEVPRNMREGSTELERAKSAAKGFIAEQIGIVTEGTKLNVIEAVNKAATVKDVYIAFFEFIDKQISKAVLGQTLTTEIGSTGSYAAAQTHNDVRQDLKELDAKCVAETLTAQLIRPWIRRQFGPAAPVPTIVFDVSEPVDEKAKADAQKVRAETLDILSQKLKIPLSREQIRQEFDIREPENEEDAVNAAPPPPNPFAPPGLPPAQVTTPPNEALSARSTNGRGATDGQAYLDGLIAKTASEGARAIRPDLAAIMAAVRTAKDYDDLKAMCVAALSDMDPTASAELVERATIMANLSGRLAVLSDV